MHLVELLDADTEELKREIFGLLLIHLVVTDDAQDEPALTIRAVPRVSISARLLMTVVTVVGLMSADVAPIAVSGLRNKPGVLDFLIDRALQKIIELLAFGFDLADVREFDFDGYREAVAAVLRQTELLAVVGAEFDCHGV